MIYCRWTDHISIDDWTSVGELKEQKLPIIETLGWKVFEDEERVAIAVNKDTENETASCVMIIDKKCIVEINEITGLVYG